MTEKRFPLPPQTEELRLFMPGTPQLTIRPARDGEEPHVEVQGPVAELEQLESDMTRWAMYLCFADFGKGAGAFAWGEQLRRRMREGSGNTHIQGAVVASGAGSIAIGACGSVNIGRSASGDSSIVVAGYDIKELADEPIVLNAAAAGSPFAVTVVVAPRQFGFKR